jgi:hypothetical protein
MGEQGDPERMIDGWPSTHILKPEPRDDPPGSTTRVLLTSRDRATTPSYRDVNRAGSL